VYARRARTWTHTHTHTHRIYARAWNRRSRITRYVKRNVRDAPVRPDVPDFLREIGRARTRVTRSRVLLLARTSGQRRRAHSVAVISNAQQSCSIHPHVASSRRIRSSPSPSLSLSLSLSVSSASVFRARERYRAGFPRLGYQPRTEIAALKPPPYTRRINALTLQQRGNKHAAH